MYKNPEEICLNGKTASYNYEMTMEKCRLLEANGFEVRKWWECEVEALLKENSEMQSFFATIEDNSTFLRLREAFYGGRVGPSSLKCDLSEIDGALNLYEIRYFDIVSLYPYTNFNCEVFRRLQTTNSCHFPSIFQYPIGHPKVEVEDKKVEWKQASDNSYKGILKVRFFVYFNKILK